MKKINLTRDQVTLVDDEDYEKVLYWHEKDRPTKWYATWTASGFYAEKRLTEKQIESINTEYPGLLGDSKNLLMHRLIMEAPRGMSVDHINGDRLDNRKQNLRVCTHSQNCANKPPRRDSATGLKGVWKSKEKCSKPFWAYIGPPGGNGKVKISLGYFETAELAAMAYDEKAKELYGEFAYLNFPEKAKDEN